MWQLVTNLFNTKAGREMRIEKRENHNVLYLSTGVQAIKLPATIDVKQVKQLLADLPPTTPSRRKKSIAILNENGIKAS